MKMSTFVPFLNFDTLLNGSLHPPSCDLSKVSQPVAPTPLPSPSLIPQLVTIGRGIQEYSCFNSSSKPASIGAIASLFNASCIAANNPDLLTLLPALTLELPVSHLYTILEFAGRHFFLNSTTPVFAISSPNPMQDFGFVVAKKVASSDAPANAAKGLMGNGAVPWVYLESTNATVGSILRVYRVNTAGGGPPTTCEGKPAVFKVEYAAEYWMY